MRFCQRLLALLALGKAPQQSAREPQQPLSLAPCSFFRYAGSLLLDLNAEASTARMTALRLRGPASECCKPLPPCTVVVVRLSAAAARRIEAPRSANSRRRAMSASV